MSIHINIQRPQEVGVVPVLKSREAGDLTLVKALTSAGPLPRVTLARHLGASCSRSNSTAEPSV